jgi:hypothetical protein
MQYTSVHYIMLSAGATGMVKSSYCKQQVPFLELVRCRGGVPMTTIPSMLGVNNYYRW